MTSIDADRPAMSAPGFVLPWIVIVVLGFAVPAVFLASTPGSLSENVVLMFALVLWSTWRLVQSGMQGRRRLTLLCAYVFTYVFLGVQPLLSVWSGAFPYPEPMPDGLIMATIALVVVGLAAMEFGYRLPAGRGTTRAEMHLAKAPLPAPPVWLSMLWVGVGAGLALTVASIVRYGPGLYLGVRDGGFSLGVTSGLSLSQAEWLIAVNGVRALLATLMFLSMYLWKARHDHDWPPAARRRLTVILALLIVVNIVISNPLSAPRLWSGALIVTMLFIGARWRGARSFLLWTIVASTSLLILFAGIDPRRIIAQPLKRGEPVTLVSTVRIINESVQNVQADANFDAFQMIGLSKQFADEKGYSLGRQLLLPAFFWIPRSVWPSKPIGTSDLVAESLGFFSTNVGSPLWAEGYVNFGILGVVVFLGCFGYLARRGDNFLTRTASTSGPMIPTIIWSFFAANTFILLRGDLTTGTMFLQMICVLTVLLAALTDRYRPPSRPPAEASPIGAARLGVAQAASNVSPSP